MITLETSSLPALLAHEAATAWANILEHAHDGFVDALHACDKPQDFANQLARVLACSPFVAETLRRQPQLLLELLQSGQLHSSIALGDVRKELLLALTDPGAELLAVLRRTRQRHMVRIVWRDFCRIAITMETVRDTSLLAEATIDVALQQVQAELEQRFGQPVGARSGQVQKLIVLAMGKLGARELNVSSDIDLIFTYAEAGETDSATRPISNEEFFTRVGRALISALDQLTADGFVFRVDMRLRPYGESGALVHSFAALESYYQEQGRDWERYALIKANPITGDAAQGAELMAMLKPFVYRRYVDFGAIESLRNMKEMIASEVRRRGLHNNVKLGHGGIREVEFIAQCFQLIRGGRDRLLQQRELLPVLHACGELGCLPDGVPAQLTQAYLFLRDTEHAIQGYLDKQSQDLPDSEKHRAAMACCLGFDRWEAFAEALEGHRATVAEHFNELIAAPDEDAQAREDTQHWNEMLSVTVLAELGYQVPQQTHDTLLAFKQHSRVTSLQSTGLERLDQFMPMLLRACAEAPDPDLALARVLPLVAAVVRRSAYLVLLMENPPALVELVAMCGASPWIAEQMASHPVLLDEYLDRASLYSAPDKDLLYEELQQQLVRIPLDDLEAQMDGLRYFKAAHVLRVATSELAGRLPLMKVSDKLTWIAEAILDQVIALAWDDLTRKYGEPQRDSQGSGFCVFAYGKMGGLELGYGSDLDLVFIQDSQKNGVTQGEHSIDNAVFYTRLGQRIIHILEARMAMGQLYEVDMRLRPSGESGMLVSSVASFSGYQGSSAWTWEHQALVRARYVAGDATVAEAVAQVRSQTICKARDTAELARDVVSMREKMRKHLLSEEKTGEGEFHLKQGEGGIVDIEFMVQYAVLAWSHREPELARWSDNVRILETLGRKGLFEQQECDALTQAYIAYRSAAHQLSLQQQPGIASAANFAEHREAVMAKWQGLFAPYINETEQEEAGV
ncbi:MAG: bifunctional [glutamate--ammonia ligase]-adenylyl-L-tyrosine phosphorylase/[glutamate--ammonia-ligase] adenylyltransferase [Gammaproteobacteria bacterium]|nr:bifunctional [glutamate--ammonia ligase]-adenylyl-L-tyrosine phosphorylase/[glutamate--ammonia-ligase] adenylyltransferase [Gammaproteobacteria bacterium]